jgi:hypothetical protein
MDKMANSFVIQYLLLELDFGSNCEAEAQKNLAGIKHKDLSDTAALIKERLILKY